MASHAVPHCGAPRLDAGYAAGGHCEDRSSEAISAPCACGSEARLLRIAGNGAIEWAMTQLVRQSLVAYGAPLCETVADCPPPRGSEVQVAVVTALRPQIPSSDAVLRIGEITFWER